MTRWTDPQPAVMVPSPEVGLKALAILHGRQAYRDGIYRGASVSSIIYRLESRTDMEVEDDLIDDLHASWLLGWDAGAVAERAAFQGEVPDGT